MSKLFLSSKMSKVFFGALKEFVFNSGKSFLYKISGAIFLTKRRFRKSKKNLSVEVLLDFFFTKP